MLGSSAISTLGLKLQIFFKLDSGDNFTDKKMSNSINVSPVFIYLHADGAGSGEKLLKDCGIFWLALDSLSFMCAVNMMGSDKIIQKSMVEMITAVMGNFLLFHMLFLGPSYFK